MRKPWQHDRSQRVKMLGWRILFVIQRTLSYRGSLNRVSTLGRKVKGKIEAGKFVSVIE